MLLYFVQEDTCMSAMAEQREISGEKKDTKIHNYIIYYHFILHNKQQ